MFRGTVVILGLAGDRQRRELLIAAGLDLGPGLQGGRFPVAGGERAGAPEEGVDPPDHGEAEGVAGRGAGMDITGDGLVTGFGGHELEPGQVRAMGLAVLQLQEAVLGSAPTKPGEGLSRNAAADPARPGHGAIRRHEVSERPRQKAHNNPYARIVRKMGVILLGPGVLVVGVSAANLHRPSSTEAIDWRIVKHAAKQVNVESPTRGPIIQTVTAPGVVEPQEVAQISSQVVGRVVQLCVEDGDFVKDGDLLLRLDDEDARAKLDSADARCSRLREAIAQVEADLRKAERDALQHGRLAGRGYSSQTELADARTVVSKAQAALRMSRMELAESEAMRRTSLRDLQRTEIRSPVRGVVSDLNVDVGEVVIAGTTNVAGTVLMNVCNLSGMRIRADVDETDVSSIHRGQPAQAYLQADQRAPIAGKVDRVGAKGKRSGDVVSYETRIEVDGASSSLRAGMTATVKIEIRRVDDAFGIPVQGVVHRQRKDLPDTPEVRAWCERNGYSPGERSREGEARYIKVAFVLDRGVARARPVETGMSDERRVEILSGLEPEERVIVGPFRVLDELKDGQPAGEIVASGEQQ